MSEADRRTRRILRGRLHHEVPHWVNDHNAVFHIRIRCQRPESTELTRPDIAVPLLESAIFYADQGRWWPKLFLLMPDHIHGLISFPFEERMSAVIGDWKRYQEGQQLGIVWQENYFDHRLRSAGASSGEKEGYIRRNSVVKGLCESENAWQWWFAMSEIGDVILKGGSKPTRLQR